MSSAVFQSTIQKVEIAPSHATAVMKAIAPSVDALATAFLKGVPAESKRQVVEATATLIDIQTSLAAAERILKISINPTLLTSSQGGEAGWVRDTYSLIRETHEHLRSTIYQPDAKPVELLCTLITTDTGSGLSLPRLLRAFAKSSFYSHLYLGVPSHREELSIETAFNQPGLSKFLANPTHRV